MKIHLLSHLLSEILGLMSPVHRSNSNMDASGSALAVEASIEEEDTRFLRLRDHHSYNTHMGNSGGLESQSIQRSYSMPPAMFEVDGAVFLPSERGEARTGQNHSSRRRNLRQRMLESQSEDELTTSGGREGDVESDDARTDDGQRQAEGAEGGASVDGTRPRGRRNAFRGNAMLIRRATCAADGSIAEAAGTARHNVSGAVQEESGNEYVN